MPDEEVRERDEQQEEGLRQQRRDHALTRLDETEVKARMVDAFDDFVQMGFEVHLIGVEQRETVNYKLLLAEDGADDVPLGRVQKVADKHRMDIFVERGLGLALYARW